jgi:VWFA-related protein
MTLRVSVESKSGTPVANLSAADFRVLDNKAEQRITSFHALSGPEAQAEVIVVLDSVNVPYSRVAYARQEIDRALTANDGRLPQPTALGVLEDRGIQIQPGFTTDGNSLKAALDNYTVSLRTITRSAGFYGAEDRLNISLSAMRMLITREAERPGRKVIVWISPGWPLLGGPSVTLSSAQRRGIFDQVVALSTQMREGGITVDAVNPLGAAENVGYVNYYQSFLKGVEKPSEVDLGDLGLQVLAIQSGGLVLNGSNDVRGLLQRCFAQLRGTYDLSIEAAPGERPNEYHQLQVKVTRPGLTAHASTGYYARPSFDPAAQRVPVPVGGTK